MSSTGVSGVIPDIDIQIDDPIENVNLSPVKKMEALGLKSEKKSYQYSDDEELVHKMTGGGQDAVWHEGVTLGWGEEGAGWNESDDVAHKMTKGEEEASTDDDVPSLEETNGHLQPLENTNNNRISVNGIDHDMYGTLTSSAKGGLSQCQYCLKYYNKTGNSMVTTEYDQKGDVVCFHCVYMLIYSDKNSRINFDGAFGKTIVEYIIECKDSHDKENCTHQTECFICDYLNGIFIENILGGDELFATNEFSTAKNEVDSPETFSVDICI